MLFHRSRSQLLFPLLFRVFWPENGRRIVIVAALELTRTNAYETYDGRMCVTVGANCRRCSEKFHGYSRNRDREDTTV